MAQHMQEYDLTLNCGDGGANHYVEIHKCPCCGHNHVPACREVCNQCGFDANAAYYAGQFQIERRPSLVATELYTPCGSEAPDTE